MEGHTTRMWERITGITGSVDGARIVEFGCGPGRFLDVVKRKGGVAVGVELSSAVESARANFTDDPNVLVVQADLLNAPFRPGSFDAGYSIGVLHHTPNPGGGLQALAELVRPQGWIACSVYPKNEFYDYRSVERARRLNHALNGFFAYRAALFYSYFSGYLISPIYCKAAAIPGLRQLLEYLARNWMVVLCIPDRRWRVLDIFDAITPEIATTHTGEEVESWFKAAGCGNVHKTEWGDTSVVGIKI